MLCGMPIRRPPACWLHVTSACVRCLGLFDDVRCMRSVLALARSRARVRHVRQPAHSALGGWYQQVAIQPASQPLSQPASQRPEGGASIDALCAVRPLVCSVSSTVSSGSAAGGWAHRHVPSAMVPTPVRLHVATARRQMGLALLLGGHQLQAYIDDPPAHGGLCRVPVRRS